MFQVADHEVRRNFSTDEFYYKCAHCNLSGTELVTFDKYGCQPKPPVNDDGEDFEPSTGF